MSDLERILPVAAVAIVGTMMINGTTLPGIAAVASVVLFFYAKTRRCASESLRRTAAGFHKIIRNGAAAKPRPPLSHLTVRT